MYTSTGSSAVDVDKSRVSARRHSRLSPSRFEKDWPQAAFPPALLFWHLLPCGSPAVSWYPVPSWSVAVGLVRPPSDVKGNYTHTCEAERRQNFIIAGWAHECLSHALLYAPGKHTLVVPLERATGRRCRLEGWRIWLDQSAALVGAAVCQEDPTCFVIIADRELALHAESP